MSDSQDNHNERGQVDGATEPQPDRDETVEETARTQQTYKTHLFVTVSHWGMVLLIVLAILSGMRLGWGYIDSSFGGEVGMWSALIGAIAPKGSLFGVNLIDLHVTVSFGVLAVVVLYFVYLLRSRTLTRLRFTSRDMQKLREGMNSGSF